MNSIVVIDNGCTTIKAGIGGDHAPIIAFPAVYGTPRIHGKYSGAACPGEYFVGHDAENIRDILKLTSPIKGGLIHDYDGMAKIWQYIYQKLSLDLDANPCLMSVSPQTQSAARLAEVCFETLSMTSLLVADQASLAIAASGSTTGTVLQLEKETSGAYPVYETCLLRSATTSSGVFGEQILNYLKLLLQTRGHNLDTKDGYADLQAILQHHCYVAGDFTAEQTGDWSNLEVTQTLRNGHSLVLNNERYKCLELLFKPELNGLKCPGIQDMVLDCIMKCSSDLEHELFGNIVLSGEFTMLPGLANRLRSELEFLSSAGAEVRVATPSARNDAPWLSGSLLCHSDNFDKMLISKNEYLEYGDRIVTWKSFPSLV